MDVVSPKPFDVVMGDKAKAAGGAEEKGKPEWRRSFQQEGSWTPRPSSVTVSPSTYATRPTAPVRLKPAEAQWGAAFGYGLLVALGGGFIWGLIGGFLGYIFALVAIGIGLGVAWAVRKGAGTANWGVIALAIFFTILAIFIGQIIAYSIAGSAYGLSVLDIIVNYPTIFAIAPGEVCLSYFFGLMGAVYGAYSLYKEMASGRARGTTMGYPQYATGPQTFSSPASFDAGFAGSTVAQSEKPSVEVLARTATHAHIRVSFPPPVSSTLTARYETMAGKASVSVNGIEVAKTRVWGAQKVLEVPLPKHPARIIRVRFYGIPSPHIEVSAGGSLIATC